MDTNVTDADDTTAQRVIGARFRAAREAAGLSRAQVERASNVSQKAIEKFEAGLQSPNFVRFAALCAAVGKTVDEMLNGRATRARPGTDETDDESATPPPGDDQQSEVDPVEDALSRIDELRQHHFHDGQRKAIALVAVLRDALKSWEPAALLTLARKRGVDRGTCPSALDLQNALAADTDKGQAACAAVEERIIDTAVLGADLFSVPYEQLCKIADQLKRQFELDEGFFGWGKPPVLVPMLREPMRQLAVAGKGVALAAPGSAPVAA